MNATHSQPTVQLIDDVKQRQHYQSLVERYGSPLLVYDAERLRQQYLSLKAALPGVELYYAVKAHPDSAIIETIDQLKGNFDISSTGETALMLNAGIPGHRTLYTHPIKKDRDIADALRFGTKTFVVDNLSELKKIVPYRAHLDILLRLSFRSSSAKVDLSRKFGCDVSEAKDICIEADKLGINIKGFSFHVGSQCENADKHVEAIESCHEVMLALGKQLKQPLNTLDIGGGFPADYALRGLDIRAWCQPIKKALSALPEDWSIIAEPGRYLVAAAVEGIATVTGKSLRDGLRWYYLDDGVYGSYSGQIFDYVRYPLSILNSQPSDKTFGSVLAGPTCDSIDIVAEDIQLPELEIGDLVIGHQMGAYTAATRTQFNLLPNAKFVSISEIAASDIHKPEQYVLAV